MTMDHRAEVSDFLRTRRDRIALPGGDPRRRASTACPGCRREEVAAATGISVEYYARIDVPRRPARRLDGGAGSMCTLLLDEAETDHLHDLAEAAGRRPVGAHVRPSSPSPIRCSASSTRSPCRCGCGTVAWTWWRRIPSAVRCTRRCSRTPPRAEHGEVRLLQPGLAHLLPRLGGQRHRHRRDAARLCGADARQAAQRPHRREQTTRSDDFPGALGRARRAPPPHRPQAHPPPRGGDLEARLRGHGLPRPSRLVHVRVHRRARLASEEQLRLLGDLAQQSADGARTAPTGAPRLG